MSARRLRHSIGLLIINNVPDSEKIIAEVKQQFLMMNMYFNVVYNKNADDIRKELKNLRTFDSSIVEEIIVVIQTKRDPKMAKGKFVCNGDLMDIQNDIVKPLLCVDEFKTKFKLILVGGALSNTELTPTDSKNSDVIYGSGKRVCIYSSEDTKFISTVISKFVEKKGNISAAINSKEVACLNLSEENSEGPTPKVWQSQFNS